MNNEIERTDGAVIMTRVEAEQAERDILRAFGSFQQAVNDLRAVVVPFYLRQGWIALEFPSFDKWAEERLPNHRNAHRQLNAGLFELALSAGADQHDLTITAVDGEALRELVNPRSLDVASNDLALVKQAYARAEEIAAEQGVARSSTHIKMAVAEIRGEPLPTFQPVERRSAELPEESPAQQLVNAKLYMVDQSIAAGARYDFYTIGYSGKTIQQFIHMLLHVEVDTLIDIRRNPVSMYKPEFSRENLARELIAAGIAYHHLPQFGISTADRSAAAEQGSREVLWEQYDAKVLPEVRRYADDLLSGYSWPVAFMCVEADPTSCHRHRFATALTERGKTHTDL